MTARQCDTCGVSYAPRPDYRDVHDALGHATRPAPVPAPRGRVIEAPAWEAPDVLTWAGDMIAAHGIGAPLHTLAAYAFEGYPGATVRTDAPRYAPAPAPAPGMVTV